MHGANGPQPWRVLRGRMARKCSDEAEDRGERPRLSVVITTRKRPAALVEAVRSVFAGTVRDVEVVVVDQSDDCGSARALTGAFPDEARLVYRRHDGRGSSRGRNAGLRLATADIIAITDDDCTVPEDWAERILSEFERLPTVDLLFGQVDALPHDYSAYMVPVALWTRRRIESRLERRSARLQGISANMAARRTLFEQIGGFDEWFGVGSPRWCSEDFELHFRALSHGYGTVVEPDIRILHHGMRPMRDAWDLWRRDALGNGALAAHIVRQRHPLAALRFWWWNVGRVALNAFFRLLFLRRPTGVRLTCWMIWHSLAGFLAEWRAPGPPARLPAIGGVDDTDEALQAGEAGGHSA